MQIYLKKQWVLMPKIILLFFRKIFEYYGINYDNWTKVQSVDKAAINVRIGEIINKPIVPYMNHLLNLEVYLIEKNNTQFSTINAVYNTMKDIKNSIKSNVILYNLIPYWPTLCNKMQ